MKKSLIFILLFGLLLSPFGFAQSILADNETFAHQNCFSGPFVEYDSWLAMIAKGSQRKAKTHEELERRLAKFKEAFPKEKFDHYKESIECTLGSQYRGAFDKEVVNGEYDEFGGSDVLDVVKLAKYIPYITGVDSAKVGMYGSSRGGMQTFLAMQKMPEVKAVATIAGASDLLRELAFRPSMENVYKARIPNYDANKEVELGRRSVLKWVDKLNKSVPILIQYGDRDDRVSVENAKWLTNALEQSEHPHRLSIYKNEGHGWSPKTKPTAQKELADWFHQYL